MVFKEYLEIPSFAVGELKRPLAPSLGVYVQLICVSTGAVPEVCALLFCLLSAVALGQKGLEMCSALFLANLMPFRSHLASSTSNFNISLWISDTEF